MHHNLATLSAALGGKRRALLSASLVAVLVAGSSQIAVPSASAGWLCDTTGACGVVTNSPYSARFLDITNTYDPITNVRTLTQGQKSTMYFKDTDAFRVPSGCTAALYSGGTVYNYYAGWNKISDGVTGTVRIYC